MGGVIFKMNIKIVSILIGIVLVGAMLIIPISIFGSGLIDKYSYYRSESIDLSKESINGVKIGEDFKEIKENITDLDDKSDDWFTYKKSTNVRVDKKNMVDSVYSESNNVNTQKQINLNSSRKEIASAYGDKYYKREEQGFKIKGYPDKKLKINLEFWYLNSKLEKILLVKR
jgi:hypothetical protein